MIKIYDTMTRSLRDFVPLTENTVNMYVCGPTVYNYIHIGNARPVVVFDVLRRYLEYTGQEVCFVQNFTDVDDKIINKAREENVSAHEISERYIAEFQKDFASLNLRTHSQNPKVTEFIPQIVSFVSELIEKNRAYVTAKDPRGAQDVVYSIESFADYGKLSGRDPEDLQAGSRVDVNESKKNPLDFVLWKSAKEGEPAWESPWGAGRPGWRDLGAPTKQPARSEVPFPGGYQRERQRDRSRRPGCPSPSDRSPCTQNPRTKLD